MDVPSGVILLWFGSIATIPAGFVICDGNNGTPNLKNRFVVGAGDTYAVDASGGAIAHNHNFIGDGHNHVMAGGVGLGAGIELSSTTTTDAVTGTTDNGNSIPPYHSLAYIMRS